MNAQLQAPLTPMPVASTIEYYCIVRMEIYDRRDNVTVYTNADEVVLVPPAHANDAKQLRDIYLNTMAQLHIYQLVTSYLNEDPTLFRSEVEELYKARQWGLRAEVTHVYAPQDLSAVRARGGNPRVRTWSKELLGEGFVDLT